MERNVREIHKIVLTVAVEIAEEYMARDAAMLELRTGYGDNNKSKYTEKEFIKEIKDGNVVVAMLRDDPIGYAILKDGKVDEYYVEWGFKESELENILKNAKISKNTITKTIVEID